MATAITIEKVNYGNSVSGPQTWTIAYKKWDDPGAYTVVDSAAVADAGGVLSSPVVIGGLTAGELYYVQTSNNCQSPATIYQQSIQLTS